MKFKLNKSNEFVEVHVVPQEFVNELVLLRNLDKSVALLSQSPHSAEY